MKKDLSGRVYLLDELRGLDIICMVIYHVMYDLVVLFRVDLPLFTSPLIQDFAQPLIAGTFIFISGIAGHYSRSNVKRGAICFGFGMIFTLVTYFVMPRAFIAFGVLHFLGLAMMLFPLLKKAAMKLPPLAGAVIGLLLFWFFYDIPSGSIGLAPLFSLEMPQALYSTPYTFWLGLPHAGFYSSDYFPLLPWIFLFFAGICFGRLVKDRRCPAWIYKPHCRPLAFIGRNTIWIYLLHQPICYGVLWVIFSVIQ